MLGAGIAGLSAAATTPAHAATQIDVRKYGARADNVTDSTTAFKQALNAAARAVRNSLGLIPADVIVPGNGGGAYRVGNLRIPSRVRLVGTGTDPRIAAYGAQQRWLQSDEGAQSAGIRDLLVDANGLVRTAVVTASPGSASFTLTNVRITNTTGTRPPAGVDARLGVRGLTIDGCTIRHTDVGVRLPYDPYNTRIVDTTFLDWTERAVWVRSDADHAANILLIEGCWIGAPARGGSVRQPIQINGDDGRVIRQVTIRGNTVTGAGTDYYDARTPGTADLISLHRCDDFEVSGNVVRNGGDVGITVSQQSRNGVVAGNTCASNFGPGISIGSGTSTFVSNIQVLDNRCVDNGRLSPYDRTKDHGRTGIIVRRGKQVKLERNRSGNTSESTSQFYGLALIQSTDVSLTSNDLSNNARREIYRA